MARKSDLWKLGKAGKTITFEHLKTRSGCKIFLGKPDDIFIHNTKMIDYLLNLQPEMRKFAIFICKWFKRARVLFSLKTYSLVLMIITYAQKHKFMPSMVQLKQKCLEMTKDKESYASDAEWLNEFKHDVLLKDLELEEMTDYKVSDEIKDLKHFLKLFCHSRATFKPFSNSSWTIPSKILLSCHILEMW